MAQSPTGPDDTTIELACEVVAAYVSKNALSATDLPKLIADVYNAVRDLQSPVVVAPVEKPSPAVSIRKSITPDYLICLDDGKRFKSLKRHLAQLGMTPEQYREKWGLPSDYPMVAPNYSVTRSAMAKSFGLGRRADTEMAPAAEPTNAAPAKGASRRKNKAQA